mmetsp:Transcript_68631/g.107318  ORF Transcript_68631/g.107318 Transcript_68631/m.107318 type:complete len:163 (-) Transcript_68631:22-510(-)
MIVRSSSSFFVAISAAQLLNGFGSENDGHAVGLGEASKEGRAKTHGIAVSPDGTVLKRTASGDFAQVFSDSSAVEEGVVVTTRREQLPLQQPGSSSSSRTTVVVLQVLGLGFLVGLARFLSRRGAAEGSDISGAEPVDNGHAITRNLPPAPATAADGDDEDE